MVELEKGSYMGFPWSLNSLPFFKAAQYNTARKQGEKKNKICPIMLKTTP